ncbi:MAG: hypothetical protein ABSH53_09350 [Holophaga sp.]|jgi:hypothetical protein
MKAFLMHRDRDFDLRAPGPAQAADLVQDLELPTLTRAMADGDPFLLEVANKVFLRSWGVGGGAAAILRAHREVGGNLSAFQKVAEGGRFFRAQTVKGMLIVLVRDCTRQGHSSGNGAVVAK